MFRKLTLSMALGIACVAVSSTQAQSDSGRSQESASGNTVLQGKLASYTRNYASANAATAQTPQSMAYGRSWGGAASNRDASRFYHYPYVYYPQNFRGSEYYRSSDSMYFRYPPEMQIPVYNRHWQNYYPAARRYHWGHHFTLDVF